MRDDRLQVAVWGLGPHAVDKILPAIAVCPRTELAGVVTRNREIATEVAARFGCTAWDTPEEMLSQSRVDAVFIVTPIGLHGEHAERVLAVGKHVWCEKSLTNHPPSALELVARGRCLDLAVCEAFMYVHHPQFVRMCQLVRAPAFGEAVSATVRFGLPPLARPGFRSDRALGGGAFWDVACYPIHLLSELFGVPLGATSTIEPHDGGVDREGCATLRFASGRRAFIEWGVGLAYRNEAFIWGRQQALAIDRVFSKRPTEETTMVLSNLVGQANTITVEAANAFIPMLEALADSVVDATAREAWWCLAERQAKSMALVEGAAGLISPTPTPRPWHD